MSGNLAENRKAKLNFLIEERFEAGIELTGNETKAIRAGKASLEGARVLIRGGEAFVVGLHIEHYQPKNMAPGHETDRTRRILLKKKEILRLATSLKGTPLTILPISLYNKSGKIKVEVALCKNKSKHDKREALREKDDKLRMRQAS